MPHRSQLHGLKSVVIPCIVQLHGPDIGTPYAEVVRTLDDLTRAGKVRYVGACNMAGWQMQKLVETTRQLNLNPFVVLQVQPSLCLYRGREKHKTRQRSVVNINLRFGHLHEGNPPLCMAWALRYLQRL